MPTSRGEPARVIGAGQSHGAGVGRGGRARRLEARYRGGVGKPRARLRRDRIKRRCCRSSADAVRDPPRWPSGGHQPSVRAPPRREPRGAGRSRDPGGRRHRRRRGGDRAPSGRGHSVRDSVVRVRGDRRRVVRRHQPRAGLAPRSGQPYKSAALRSNAFHFAGDMAGSLAVLAGWSP